MQPLRIKVFVGQPEQHSDFEHINHSPFHPKLLHWYPSDATEGVCHIPGVTMKVHIKRVYEAPSDSDGKRILVDRLWPRGISKEAADLFAWMREVAPSAELRTWFDHDTKKWKEFQQRYRKELASNAEYVELQKLALHSKVTLVYAAKDTEHNNAVVLQELLAAH